MMAIGVTAGNFRCHWKSCMSETEPFSASLVQIQSPPAANRVSVFSSVVCQAPFMNVRLCAMKVPALHVPWRLQSSVGVVSWTVMSHVLS